MGVTQAHQKMAAGSPFSGQSIYETGPLLSSANPVGRGAGGGGRGVEGEGRGASFDCK